MLYRLTGALTLGKYEVRVDDENKTCPKWTKSIPAKAQRTGAA
jgi:hypothetical protein